jgi:hypothetical protein
MVGLLGIAGRKAADELDAFGRPKKQTLANQLTQATPEDVLDLLGQNPDYLKTIGFQGKDTDRAAKSAMTRFGNALQNNPEFLTTQQQILESPMVYEFGPLAQRNIIRPEDLEGDIMIGHKGDTTATDMSLLSLAGYDLVPPVISRGGFQYPLSPLTPQGNYWASMLTAAKPLRNKAALLRESEDADVTGMYMAMGQEGSYFNQAFADALFRFSQARNLPEASKKIFDEKLRKVDGMERWVGLDHPDAYDQLMGRGDYPMEGAGKLRSAFTKTMGEASFRNQGFFPLGILDNLFLDPELQGAQLGDTGMMMGRIGDDLGLETNHPSYDTPIMGQALGGFQRSLPPRIAFPDAYKILDKELTKPKKGTPRLFTEAEKIDAIAKRKDLFQKATPEWVDKASTWLEQNPRGTTKALLAAIGIPLAFQSEESEAGIVAKLSQATQRGNTLATAKASQDYLAKMGGQGRSIDYGAGLGTNAQQLGVNDTFEPFPREGFNPTYQSSADIPANSYGQLISTNVLNVIPPEARKTAVLNIGEILEPNGMAVVQTRSASAVNELKKSKTAVPQDEPASYLTKDGTYQKGFTRDELVDYTRNILGDGFEVSKIPAKDMPNGSGVLIRKLPTIAAMGMGASLLFPSEDTQAAPSVLKSIALDAMAKVPRKSPTSYTGWKKALNRAGIKDDELKQMGFKREFEFRQRAQDITRKEVEDFLSENQYNIREEVLGQKKEFGEVVFDPELRLYNAVMPDAYYDQGFHTREQAEAYIARNPDITTEYEYAAYTHGGPMSNYREIQLLDGPEADKYEALTKQINKLEGEIEDAAGLDRGYLKDALVEFDEASDFAKPFDRLQELRAERNSLPQPFLHRHYSGAENMLSHLRVSDRDLEDGSSTLMVEEIQSDLHQRGQEFGYVRPNELAEIEAQRSRVNSEMLKLNSGAVSLWAEENMPEVYKKAYTFDGSVTADESTALRKKMVKAFDEDYKKRTGKDRDEEFERLADLRDNLKERQLRAMNAAPDMPFKTDDKSSWYDLSFKRALLEAADGDYDNISFTLGKEQVRRYGESAEGGVKKFYDVTLPNHINKWAKKYGVKLQRKPLNVTNNELSIEEYDDETYFVRDERGNAIEDFDTRSEAADYIKKNTNIDTVLTLPITKEMRDDINEKGMALFSDPLIQAGVYGSVAAGTTGLLPDDDNQQTTNVVYDDRDTRREQSTQSIMDMLAADAKQERIDNVKNIAANVASLPAAINEGVQEGLLEALSFIPEQFAKAGASLTGGDAEAAAARVRGFTNPVVEASSPRTRMLRDGMSENIAYNTRNVIDALTPAAKAIYQSKGLIRPSLEEIVGGVKSGYQNLPEGYFKDNVLPATGYGALGVLGLLDFYRPKPKALTGELLDPAKPRRVPASNRVYNEPFTIDAEYDVLDPLGLMQMVN